ncbi:response regulator [Dolichospermum flos-aquae]|uniref:Uncharacterized protein n=1 Tax=Dolichospermum flos-aquae LEGE 04289 TaxID=1828708 RepID=A0ACC5Q0N0_DOLFA|nr:hypothetical protein [Dolichospermum flos-aquae]MBE9219033.1 hypothetical protein [Dolichospermum flos-aquae LEGE 04289]
MCRAWLKIADLLGRLAFRDRENFGCDGTLNHLTVAMLTSRGADKHRKMAIQLGASGYFTN